MNQLKVSNQVKSEYKKDKKLKYVKLKEYIDNIKKNSKCSVCGESRWYLLDFHHISKDTKISNIPDMIHRGCTMKELNEELDKCTIVCANCHREIHYLEDLKK